MRITGGKLRGRRLKLLRSGQVRPAAGRVREAVFSVLGQNLAGHTVLDLYAGSGAFGIEALSRGADFAYFVEKDPAVARTLASNLAVCSLQAQSTLVRQDVGQFLKNMKSLVRRPLTVIFLDPPFHQDLAGPNLAALGESSLLAAEARVVVKHSAQELLLDEYSGLACTWRRQYGNSAISIYSRSADKSAK